MGDALDLGRFARRIIATREVAGRPARLVDLPPDLHPALRGALSAQRIEQLYSHQAEMYAAARAGRNVVITTGTASGKSLAFLLPLLQGMIEDPSARAILLYPTKALGRDQLRGLLAVLEELRGAGGPELPAGVYDGDTPPDERRWVREQARLVLSNPDMLNAGLVPAHGRQGYAQLFANLRWVVIDELHVYRGAFGAHFANLVRRLLRVCRHHGSAPRFLGSSATIANPAELAGKLCGGPFELIERDGSPSAGQRIHFWQPPLLDSGRRRGVDAEMASLLPRLVRRRHRTIAFCRGRKQTEVVLKEARDRLRRVDRNHDESRLLAAYRGGYTPLERRRIEQDLIDGRLIGVVSTNALELGIDIGALEVVVQAGFPGTRASFWQQIGRAGRRGRTADAIVLLAADPVDQYIAANPQWLVGQPSEHAVTDPDNLTVQLAHIRCAAAELPLAIDDAAIWPDLGEVIPVLQEAGEIAPVYGAWHWTGDAFPAGDFSMRGGDGDRFKVVDKSSGRTLTEMTRWQVYREAHTRAVYLHDGEQYQVEQLDLVGHVATVVPVAQNFYTQPDVRTAIEVLAEQRRGPRAVFGDVRADDVVVGYKMLEFHSHQNLGYEALRQPLALQLETEGVWWPVPRALLQEAADSDTLRGMVHAVRAVARMRTMAERADLLATSFAAPGGTALVCYDNHAGGIGFAARAFELADEILRDALALVVECGCRGGCPACVGDYALERDRVRAALAGMLDGAADEPVARPAPSYVWSDLPGCWAAVRAELGSGPGCALLRGVERVARRGDKLVLLVGSPGIARWVVEPETQILLRALLAERIRLPERWRLAAEATQEDEDAGHELRRRLEDLKRDDATNERAADARLAGGFLLPGEGARSEAAVDH